MTNLWKRSLSLVLALVMIIGMAPLNVFAEGTDGNVVTIDGNQTTTPETTAPTVPPQEEPPTEPVVEETPVEKTLPNAGVKKLDAATIVGEHYVYDLVGNQRLETSKDPFYMQVIMEFTAEDTAEKAALNYYAQYTTDFFVKISGIKNGSFVGDGC